MQSCKSHRYSPPQGGGSVTADEPKVAPPTVTRALSKGKCIRSSSLSHSPAQRHPETHHFRTPPISRGLRVSGPVYKHLQEVESTEIKADSLRR
ncbi:hypothetical protein UPYG_G00143590 [Umbra pygmaea]|uniref:Uncharacterized protein n=1 Tax=Umbra pygmaea TaxID=75934 RepID=A0ABD0X0E4_UMBPY